MSSNALDLLAGRRSVPALALAAPGPTPDELATMLTVAARVPDHGKLAPWRFLLLEGDARRDAGAALAEIFAAARPDAEAGQIEAERRQFLRAPLVVCVISTAAVHPKIPEWEQVLSAGAVCLNLLHAAHALGFAGNWLSGWAAYDAAARKVLGLAENERIAGFIHIGTPPEGKPADRDRPDIKTLTTRWNG